MVNSLVHRRKRQRHERVSNFPGGLVNCVLTLGVIVCLWALWSDDPKTYDTISSNAVGNPTPLHKLPMAPVFVDDNKQPFFIKPKHVGPTSFPISSQRRGASVTVDNGVNISPIAENTSNASIRLQVPYQSTQHHRPIGDVNTPMGRLKNISSAIGLLDNEMQRESCKRYVYLIVASCSVLWGALLAKRTLDTMQRWEQRLQEDSLAYDVAYTDTLSEFGYGSFDSASWSDQLEKFDV